MIYIMYDYTNISAYKILITVYLRNYMTFPNITELVILG